MDPLFCLIDKGINFLMRAGVRASLAFLALIFAVSWTTHERMGLVLYLAGFSACALSAMYGRGAVVWVARRLVRVRPDRFVPVPPDVEARLRRLMSGANHQAVAIYMPATAKDNRRFILGIIEGDGCGSILISERVLGSPDPILRMMLGHEIGHLHDPPERSALHNDFFLTCWCVWLAHSGASLAAVSVLFAMRLVVVGLVRMLECWEREVRADLYGALVFGGKDGLYKLERVYDEIDAVSDDGAELLREAERKPSRWIGSLAFAALLTCFFPNLAAFAAISLGSKAIFAVLPTTHPPTDVRRRMAYEFVRLSQKIV